MKRLFLLVLLAAVPGCTAPEEGLTAEDHKDLGDLYYGKGKWKNAHAQYAMAVAKDEELLEGYIALAYTCRNMRIEILLANDQEFAKKEAQKLWIEGKKWLDLCMEQDDKYPDAIHVYGLLLFDNAWYQKALKQFDQVLDYDPKHEYAHMYRSWCLFHMGVDVQRPISERRNLYREAARSMETHLKNYEDRNNKKANKSADLTQWIKFLDELSRSGEMTSGAEYLMKKIRPEGGTEEANAGQPAIAEEDSPKAK